MTILPGPMTFNLLTESPIALLVGLKCFPLWKMMDSGSLEVTFDLSQVDDLKSEENLTETESVLK